MDLMTWFMTFTVVIYTGILLVKTGKPLYRYRKAKEKVVKVEGEISSFYGEETTKRKGEIISSFFPVYSCLVDEEELVLKGVVRYFGKGKDFVGKRAVLLYDKETKELWNEKDLQVMKKQIIVRTVTIAALLLLMILTSVML